jgi:hypothetical protein
VIGPLGWLKCVWVGWCAKRLTARSKLVCKTLRLTQAFSPLWVKLTITKARTYAEGETPTRLASASRASVATLGSLKLNSGSPLRGTVLTYRVAA